MAVRMKDIAEGLGVSIVTVSKALRKHPDIAVGTRERIMARARELNYRPNLMARSLVTGRSSLVGLVVPDLTHPFFGEAGKGLALALRKRDYFLILSSSNADADLERREIEHMLAHRLDALVVASSQENSDTLRSIAEQGTPLILLDRAFPGFASHFVGSDDEAIGRLAAEHLLECGRKRLALIRGPQNNVGNGRLKGFREALEAKRMSLPEEYVAAADMPDTDGRQKGHAAMKMLLSAKRPPDAVFCFNDSVAIGAMTAVLEAGLKIPKDLALLGCGNYHYDDSLRVPLSSIDQSCQEMGARIAKLIFATLEATGPVRPRRIAQEAKIVARASTAG